MATALHNFENHIGRCGRTLVFILSAGGATCSGLASFSCQFYHFESVNNRPWAGLEPPYDSTIGADIGLFSYEITDSTEPADLREGCIAFDGRFSNFSEGNALWEAAQWCAVFSFVTSALAFFINLLEVICCSFYCSFFFASTLLWIAGALQACTFMVLGGGEFCFNAESDLECSLGTAGWLSVAACASFFAAALLLCGCPRPDPCAGDVCCKQPKRTTKQASKDSEYDNSDDEEAPKVAPIVTKRKKEPDPQDKKRQAPLEATEQKPEPSGEKAISSFATAESENLDGKSKAEREPVPIMVEKSQSSPPDGDMKEKPKGPPDSDKQAPEPQEEMGVEPESEPVVIVNTRETESQEEVEAGLGRKARAPSTEDEQDEEEQKMAEEEFKEEVDTQDAQDNDEEQIVQAERPENNYKEIIMHDGLADDEEDIISKIIDDEVMLVFDDLDSSGSFLFDEGHHAGIL